MPIRLLLLAALCSLAACASPLEMHAKDFLVEVEESKEELGPKYLLKKQYIVTLQCSMNAKDNSELKEPSIVWQHASSNESLDIRYSVVPTLSEDRRNFTSLLILRRPLNADVVNYTCNGTAKGRAPVVGTASILSRPLISFKVDGVKTFDVAIWPSEGIVINCEAEGNPVSSVEWFKERNGVIESILNSSVLNLTNLSYDTDRGFISCKSHNRYGENSAKIYLRIKNPKAYLPPLIAIILEAVTIGIIIGVYEFYMHKKRKRLESEADAADVKDD